MEPEDADTKFVLIAAVTHDANRAYCETLGDGSQKPWFSAPKWQRDSAIAGVKFALEHPDAKPSDSHESWAQAKIDAGWAYGAVKDPEAKTHPCLVPYDKLPEEQKKKDALFLAIVRALA